MPEALMSMTTSPGPGVGSVNSRSSSFRSPRKTTPRMVCSFSSDFTRAARHGNMEKSTAFSSEGGFAPLPNLPPGTGCAGEAGARSRTPIGCGISRGHVTIYSDRLLAAGGQHAHQRRDRIPPHGIVDVPLFFPALDQPRPPQLVEVVGQRWPGHPHRLLDLSRRDLALGAHQEEEHLESREMGEGLERLHVRDAGLELGKREPRYRFHVSKYINLWNP